MTTATAQVAHFSIFAGLAPVVAPVVGTGALLIRMLSRSGRIRLSLAVLRRTKADIVTLVVYDALAGIVCVLGVILLGVTRPPALVTGSRAEPLVTWSIVGLVAPVLSISILDRLPLRPIVDRNARGNTHETDGAGAIMSEGRFRATGRILEELYVAMRVREGIERDQQRVRAVKLIEERRLHFDIIAEEIEEFGKTWRRNVPRQVGNALKKRAHWPTHEDPGSDTILLVHAAIGVGWERPVEVACGRIEGTPGLGPSSHRQSGT